MDDVYNKFNIECKFSTSNFFDFPFFSVFSGKSYHEGTPYYLLVLKDVYKEDSLWYNIKRFVLNRL